MSTLSAILGMALILIILGDAFETIVLPRRVTRRVRLARLFFRYTWRPWLAMVRSLSSGKRQETYLSFYGPLSL
ncbi:MAG TPA: two pore domain potassium channel family protein, partial [Thermodesulfobacteriota bacterium]|nr:two pore domain potassium channel family protein [Thermodesulfobacteriota bacterium]